MGIDPTVEGGVAGRVPQSQRSADAAPLFRRRRRVAAQPAGKFLTALRAAGSRDVETRMITGRTHNTVWSEMAKGDDDTSRAILQFVSRLAKPSSH